MPSIQDLVTPGMPVIIIPGKRDREQNYAERVVIPYFSTIRYTEQEPVVLPDSEPDPQAADTIDSDSVDVYEETDGDGPDSTWS